MTLVLLIALIVGGCGIAMAGVARVIFLRQSKTWRTVRLIAILAMGFGFGAAILLTVHSSHTAPPLKF